MIGSISAGRNPRARVGGGPRVAGDVGDGGDVVPVDPVADAESESGGYDADRAAADGEGDGRQRQSNVHGDHPSSTSTAAFELRAHLRQTPKIAKCSMSAWNPCFSSRRARRGSLLP